MSSHNPWSSRLTELNQAWTPEQYQAQLNFYVKVLPQIFDCERCGVFVIDPIKNTVLSAFGTQIEEGELQVSLADSVVGEVISSGKAVLANDMQQRPGAHHAISHKTGYLVHHLICHPLISATTNRVIGAIQLLNSHKPQGFSSQDMDLLGEASHFIGMGIESFVLNKEMIGINQQLEQEIDRLRGPATNVVSESPAMHQIIQQVQTVAPLPVNVLITGENGTGKEQIATLLHQLSDRNKAPFIAINCSAIPETLVESELFGYEKGAFTGAAKSHPGKFEQAGGGILFLDEIGDLPLHMQPKLLRAIQEQQGQRLGATHTTHYNFRLICATNRDLKADVEAGRFREDLYYRLFAVHLELPPLRRRPEDIIALSRHFMKEVAIQFGKPPRQLPAHLLQVFLNYAWPGNVRQLRREIERMIALCPDDHPPSLDYCSHEVCAAIAAAPRPLPNQPTTDLNLSQQVDALERQLIKNALDKTHGNKQQAAKLLGLSRPGLYKKLSRLGFE